MDFPQGGRRMKNEPREARSVVAESRNLLDITIHRLVKIGSKEEREGAGERRVARQVSLLRAPSP